LEHTYRNSVNLESLIEDEREILLDLKNMMKNPKLSAKDKISAANSYAYHASVLSKLLAQKGVDAELNETSLGDFIKSVESRIARRVRVDYGRWKRRLSRKR